MEMTFFGIIIILSPVMHSLLWGMRGITIDNNLYSKYSSHMNKRITDQFVAEILLTGLIPTTFLVSKHFFPKPIFEVALEVVALSVYGFYLIHAYWGPKEFRKLRKKISYAASKAASHSILYHRFRQTIKGLESELEEFSHSRFTMYISEVPEISIKAMDETDESCTLIFPLNSDNDLLTETSGTSMDYYNSMVKASIEMKKKGKIGITRIFLIDFTKPISQKLFNFIEKNQKDDVNVKVINIEDLPTHLKKIDFGYFKNSKGEEWIIDISESFLNIKKYSLLTGKNDLEEYKKKLKTLESSAISYDLFFKKIIAPVNESVWLQYITKHDFDITPPHGLYDADVTSIIDILQENCTTEPKQTRVLILGRTPKLISRLKSIGIGEIVSVDSNKQRIRELKKPDLDNCIKYETNNWLDYKPTNKFHFILFDEALNNLNRIQFSLMLKVISEDQLEEGGHIIGRMLGRFDNGVYSKYKNITLDEAIRGLTQITDNIEIASYLICLLHSTNIAFNEELSIIDCKRWNDQLGSCVKNKLITQAQYELWRFPNDFKIYSPDIDMIADDIKQYPFSLVEKDMKGQYSGDLNSFYRILNIESFQSSN